MKTLISFSPALLAAGASLQATAQYNWKPEGNDSCRPSSGCKGCRRMREGLEGQEKMFRGAQVAWT